MSQSNIELLAQAFAGWGKDNPANMRDLLHPDCELVVPDSVPYGGTMRGVEQVIGWFTRELWRWFDEFASTPEGLIDGGDQLVVPVHVKARAKNGKTMDVHNVWIYEFREGKLIRGRVYADTAVLARHGRRRHARLSAKPTASGRSKAWPLSLCSNTNVEWRPK